MTTCTVSYFKDHALRLLDAVAAKGDDILVTRRGKPLAHIEAVRAKSDKIELGRLRGTLVLEKDIVGPLGDDDWSACR